MVGTCEASFPWKGIRQPNEIRPCKSQYRAFSSGNGSKALPMSHRGKGGVERMAQSSSSKKGHWVYRRYVTDKQTGRRIYPKKGKAIRFWVED